MSYIAKSVIFDLVDNWGDLYSIALRQIDFYLDGSKITNLPITDYLAYSTQTNSSYDAAQVFDTTLPLTGASQYNTWFVSGTGLDRISVVFNIPLEFDSIVVNNYMNGSYLDETIRGAKNVVINYSTDAITSIVYNATISNATLLYVGLFDEHVAADVEDPQILVLIPRKYVNSFEEPYGNAKKVNYIEELYRNAKRVNAIEEPTLLPAKIFNLFEESSILTWHLVNGIEELYALMNVNQKVYAEIYGLKMGTSYIEYYTDAFVPKLSMNEWYDDTYAPKVIISEEYHDSRLPTRLYNEQYVDVPRPLKLVSMRYGNKPIAKSNKDLLYSESTVNKKLYYENYGDSSTIAKRFDESYGNKPTPKRTNEELYGSGYVVRNAINQIWNNVTIAQVAIDQSYAIITGDKAVKAFPELYDLNVLDAVLKYYEERYYMVSDSSLIEDITAEVFVTPFNADDPLNVLAPDPVEVEILGIDINSGMDKYAILATLTLASEKDYINCPLLGHVECILNGYSFNLFIETKSRQTTNEGGTSYTVSLVSHTAKLDVPYSKTMVLSFTDGLYASVIVQQMADYESITVDWQLDIDWAIPSYAISANGETPLSVIKKIVNAVGAIVQTKPNGDMMIISQYPISPKDFETEEPSVFISVETDISSIDDAIEIKDGSNAFVITDQGTSGAEITLEEVEISDTQKIIRGFRVPFDDGPFDLETSGGDSISINKTLAAVTANIPVDFDDSDNPEEWEYVEFVDWVGTTSYPIYSVISWEWLSEDLGSFQLSENGTLTCTSKTGNSESLLGIKYVTKYWKWTVTGPESRHAQLYVPELAETT